MPSWAHSFTGTGVHVLVRAWLPRILMAPKIETRQKILTTFDIKIQNEDKQIFLSLTYKHSEYSMKFLIFRIDAAADPCLGRYVQHIFLLTLPPSPAPVLIVGLVTEDGVFHTPCSALQSVISLYSWCWPPLLHNEMLVIAQFNMVKSNQRFSQDIFEKSQSTISTIHRTTMKNLK